MADLSFLNQQQRILCRLLADSLFGIPFEGEENVDWNGVYRESRMQTVIIPAFWHCDRLNLDEKLRKEIQGAVQQCVFQSVQNYAYHDYLHYLMKANHIRYCVLKGTSSAAYYPEEMMRQMGDVDFLVAGKDFDRAAAVLTEDGFSPEGGDHPHHVAFLKERMEFEMHFDPPGVPDGETGKKIREYFADILENSRELSGGNGGCIVPGPFHHGLIMLLHMKGHLLSEGIGLRHLCDWAVFVNGFKPDAFRKMFEKPLKRTGLWKFTQAVSLTAHYAAGLPLQPWMGKDLPLARELLLDIFSGGNFGVKDEQRFFEGLFISERGRKRIRHNRAVQAVLSANRIVYSHWPFARKLPVLLPAGWIFFFVRRYRRTLTGERKKIHYLAAYQKSAGRKKLYQRLRLFEKTRDPGE